MTPINALQTQYSIKEEGVLHSFQSLDSLIDTLKQQSTLIMALSLANEINQLNGCSIIGKYHKREIKKHYKQLDISAKNAININAYNNTSKSNINI